MSLSLEVQSALRWAKKLYNFLDRLGGLLQFEYKYANIEYNCQISSKKILKIACSRSKSYLDAR